MSRPPFISLKEFLELTDHPGLDNRPFFKHRTGYSWLAWYEASKAAYELHGAGGPPIGSKVITLVNGHGGAGGDVRRFDGVWDQDPRFFSISDEPFTHGREHFVTMVYIPVWWRAIIPFVNRETHQLARLILEG